MSPATAETTEERDIPAAIPGVEGKWVGAQKWSYEDVQEWLDHLKLTHYREKFFEWGIDGRILVEMKKEVRATLLRKHKSPDPPWAPHRCHRRRGAAALALLGVDRFPGSACLTGTGRGPNLPSRHAETLTRREWLKMGRTSSCSGSPIARSSPRSTPRSTSSRPARATSRPTSCRPRRCPRPTRRR